MTSEDHTPGPVCLIENVKGQLVANQEALRILSAIKQPVVVVAIVGLYRTGKSYLMNRLAGKNTGFFLDSTVLNHTKGIWMWCVPHPQKPDHTLVLLDTKGLGDVEKVEEAQQKFPQSKGDVTDAILQTVKALTRKEKQIEGEHEKAEAAQAAAKLPKEMQQKNEQLMKGKEKSHQEHGERLTEKMEKEKVQMREEQQRITEHMKQARLLQKGFQKEAKRLEEERIRLQQKKPKHKRHRKLRF